MVDFVVSFLLLHVELLLLELLLPLIRGVRVLRPDGIRVLRVPPDGVHVCPSFKCRAGCVVC